MTIHSGGICWGILRDGQRREEVTDHSEVLPSSVWVIGHFFLCPVYPRHFVLCRRILCANFDFFSQTESIVLSVHVITHATSLSPLLLLFLLQLSPVSATSSLHISFLLTQIISLASQLPLPVLTPSLPYTQY